MFLTNNIWVHWPKQSKLIGGWVVQETELDETLVSEVWLFSIFETL